ncbi:hypothetical protein BZL30_8259 [Mycobacterium kansasii]|uniref:Uncharacterized protein n=1 Tax=Mycobacterium kansasii TaxID=1768 RepID=A0A1V3WHC1_MYCKA|nr:hypothetical protein BZL30_8259 [Mycobacterium kansasii]
MLTRQMMHYRCESVKRTRRPCPNLYVFMRALTAIQQVYAF